MIAVILTIHSLIVLALIGIVLLQRSEGGALGMGGGGGGGGFMTGRGAANVLTRTTSVLAALFFSTSLALAIIADTGESDERVIDELTRGGDAAPAGDEVEGALSTSTDDLLRSLGADEDAPAQPAAPAQDPAADLLDVDAAPAETPADEAAEAENDAVEPAADETPNG